MVWRKICNEGRSEMLFHYYCKSSEEKVYNGGNVCNITPALPRGQVMAERCEQTLHELTVQVWLLFHHSEKYCTLFLSGTEIRINRRTNKQTDRRSDS